MVYCNLVPRAISLALLNLRDKTWGLVAGTAERGGGGRGNNLIVFTDRTVDGNYTGM